MYIFLNTNLCVLLLSLIPLLFMFHINLYVHFNELPCHCHVMWHNSIRVFFWLLAFEVKFAREYPWFDKFVESPSQ